MVESLQSEPDLMRSVWANREQLIGELRRLIEQLQSGASRQELEALVSGLEACGTADNIANSPVLLRWLPSLLQRQQDERDTSSGLNQIPLRIQRLATATQQLKLARRLWLYPLVLFLMMTGVLVFFCLTIIPAVQEFFMDFGLQVPASTRLLFSLSAVLQTLPTWFYIALLVVLSTFGCLVILRPHWLLGFRGPMDRVVETLIGDHSAKMLGFGDDLADLAAAGATPDFAVSYAFQRRANRRMAVAAELKPVQIRGLVNELPAGFREAIEFNVQKGFDEPGLKITRINVPCLRVWASIYANRQLRESSQRWLIVVSIALNVCAGVLVAYLIKAIYGPCTQLIQGLL